MVKKVNKTKYILLVVTTILLMLVIVFFVGRSFGFFQYVKEGEVANIITIKGIEVNIESTSANALDLGNVEPMYDSLGLQREPFVFTLTNTSSRAIDFSLLMVNDEEKQAECVIEGTSTPCPELSTDYIKYAYKFNNGSYSTSQVVGDNNDILFTTTLQGNETRTVSVILWIDSNAGNEIQGSYFYGKLILQGTKSQATNFKQTILSNNKLVTTAPTLTTTSQEANEKGLYVSYETNTGDPTYYFRGAVDNNYVDFAGFTWRIVRVNEDGTVRLIMQDGINDNATYQFNTSDGNIDYMYYSNSDVAKPTLEAWYQTNIVGTNYDSYVASGNYYCEQAKVAYSDDFISLSNANMISWNNGNYSPNFKCINDNNNHGLVSSSIGMITYEETIYVGLYPSIINRNTYISNGTSIWWTMSPAGVENTSSSSRLWTSYNGGLGNNKANKDNYTIRPVINLKSDVKVTGNGTSGNPYRIVTEEKLVDAIFKDNELQQTELTDEELSTVETNNNTGKIFKSTKTNDGTPTYFFRGAVNNNYVEFAGFTWRIVRVNEDGTVRLIMEDNIGTKYQYNDSNHWNSTEYMYYNNSQIKGVVDNWYQENIVNTGYSDKVSQGYYCDEAKVSDNSTNASASGVNTMKSYDQYIANYQCDSSKLLNMNIGFITYDEAIFAGGYGKLSNSNFYLANGNTYFTMSPGGYSSSSNTSFWWLINDTGTVSTYYSVGYAQDIRPVINLKSDTIITKDSNGHYVVQ